MQQDTDAAPVARVFFLGDESVYPGWYLQHYVERDLMTTRLQIARTADAWTAATEASGYLGCRTDQIQIEGAPWPELPLARRSAR